MKILNHAKFLTIMISLFLVFVFSAGNTFGYIVTVTPSLVNTFKPIENIVNSLMLSKKVVHPYGSAYNIPDNVVFDFEIALGEVYAGYTFNTSDGEKTADSHGKLNISVKPGSTASVEGIDAGTKVTVTELQNKNGFSVSGDASKEVTIEEDGTLLLDYVNIYTPEKVSPQISLTGSKILEGRKWQEGDSFSFLLEYDGGEDNWRELDTKTVTFKKNTENFNEFDFSNAVNSLEFDNIGDYRFRISEIKGNLEGVVYDETVNYFEISVSDDDMDGSLEIEGVSGSQNVTASGNTLKVVFNNTFKPDDTPSKPDKITVDIAVSKTVDNKGTSAISPENFIFELAGEEETDKIWFASDQNGLAIHTLTFSEEDAGKTFNYTLKEIDDEREHVTYSDKIYNISINISYDKANNKLIADLVLDGNKTAEISAAFVNVYDYSAQNTPIPSTSDKSNKTFWFIMTLASGSALIILTIFRRRLGI